MARARALAARAGGIDRGDRRTARAAMEGAHVVYAKSWAAPAFYGRPDRGGARCARRSRDWCVRGVVVRSTPRPDARFMHCLPVRRNVKVADEVLDGPRSVVVRQAGNRLHAQKAVLLDDADGRAWRMTGMPSRPGDLDDGGAHAGRCPTSGSTRDASS